MRMSPAELMAHHEPEMAVEGTRVVVTFRDQGPARAFRDGLVAEATEIPRDATRLVRTISLEEGPGPHRAILELVDGDLRAHRFFVSAEDLMRALAAIPVGTRVPGLDVGPEPAPERQDDLLELAELHGRLDRAERAILHQRLQLNTLRTAFAERFVHRNGRFPSYCCQRCGEQIGWVGRAFQAVGLRLHTCRIRCTDEADRATAEAVRSKVEAA